MRISIPGRFVWDTWFIRKQDGGIAIFYLNADKELAKTEQHHFHAVVGLSEFTDKFSEIFESKNVFSADTDAWDNTSIWTGDSIFMNGKYYLFYTSRDKREDDGFTQHIGIAESIDLHSWKRIDGFCLSADPEFYETKSRPADSTIHAWRDPFIFQFDGITYMLVAAKIKDLPPDRNGGIALLEMGVTITHWKHKKVLYSPQRFGEVELPQIWKDKHHGLHLFFNAHGNYDSEHDKGGLYHCSLDSLTSENPEISRAVSIISDENNRYGFRIFDNATLLYFDAGHGVIRSIEGKILDKDIMSMK